MPMTGINGGGMDDEVVDVVLSPEKESDLDEPNKEGEDKENVKTARHMQEGMPKGG
jgi:hypothetical protein